MVLPTIPRQIFVRLRVIVDDLLPDTLHFRCFNDDVQGTGAVILAGKSIAIRMNSIDKALGVMNAVRRSGIAIEDHRLVFMGAGSAGVGVAEQIQEFFIKSGISVEQAKKMFWLVDSKVRNCLL